MTFSERNQISLKYQVLLKKCSNICNNNNNKTKTDPTNKLSKTLEPEDKNAYHKEEEVYAKPIYSL